MADIKEKRVDLILQQLDELPTLPTVALKVLEVTARENSQADEVVKLIESDPSLTARILQLVHRADLGVRGEVSSVERAVSLLGFEAVRSAVLAVTVFDCLNAPQKPSALAPAFDRDAFWKHCVSVACCAELLALKLKAVWGRDSGIDASEAFVCGLLHDLGKVALDAMLPKSFARVVEATDLLRGNIADLERTIIGLDHMVVGKRLAERWKLPVTVRECAWLHGQAPAALPATVRNPRMVNLITLADLLVREQHLGYSGNYTFSFTRQSLADAVGLGREQVDEAVGGLVEQIEPRAKALGLGSASSSDLYQQALAQANKELGRVSGQLASKNRKLAIRAKFFDALSHFQSEMRPDSPPAMVMQAIGQTAVSSIDVTSCCVFSLPPGRDYAETMLFDESGQVFETTLVDCQSSEVAGDLDQSLSAPLLAASGGANGVSRGRPNKPCSGEGPVLKCGADMEWLRAAVSPRLSHDNHFWICLEADGQCIGGVVWGAPAGDAQRLSTQAQELTALAASWSLAMRTCQIREEARVLSEQLAEANRRLQNAQNEILRSKTVITVGEMAAGAAHEMNNPLAVISGRSQLLAMQLSDPRHKAAAHLIHEQSHRLSQIISELMDFAKPIPPQIVETDCSEIIERALHEAKAVTDPADRNIEVTFADVPFVTVDPQQVSAALVEVIANAFQATDEKKGQIAIHAAFDPYSKKVVLTVADNGGGMDDATQKRAFDPFYSSKPAGRRRGMGLPKAMRWIESSGGSIRLESRPGQGTRAIVLLPAADQVADAVHGSRKVPRAVDVPRRAIGENVK